jgi:hypothetical protein
LNKIHQDYLNSLSRQEHSNNPVPTRYQYPINEQNLNEANWIQAASAIGGDAQTTKLFWDLN